MIAIPQFKDHPSEVKWLQDNREALLAEFDADAMDFADLDGPVFVRCLRCGEKAYLDAAMFRCCDAACEWAQLVAEWEREAWAWFEASEAA